MFGCCRAIHRLCWGDVFQKSLLHARALSGADAVNALRPFYFAVHPDFFGQHPREREVNENSLKRLNGYLESLQKPGVRYHKPAQLTFYVRETEQNCVNPQDPTKASGGSMGSEPKKDDRNPFYRPIKWDKTYYAFTGFKDPEEELEQAQRVETSISSWLENNQEVALKKLNSSLPLREELDRLKNELCHQLQLSDVRWQRSWGVAHRCSQLQSLSRLTQNSPESLRLAKGRSVIFTDRTGLSATGYVMLGTMDVHHYWTELFERLPSYNQLQRTLQFLQESVSHLLGGIEIVHIEELEPMLTAEEFYATLSAFYNKLLNRRVPIHPRSLRGLQMILENDRFVPRLHEMGHFSIPTACDPTTLQWFLLTHAQKARENLKRKDELKVVERELIKACKSRSSLSRLYKEPSVSCVQMIDCCRRLIEEPQPYLSAMHLCISHYYSVLQDGDLCIPWNWKS
ncbi:T-cell activation inhibitor, mitochondrial isoform X2 [Spea bombifrons]|uniref:T-cell activation inhibitor, mitochondrial isoform X2 n=1 Tax=Spea bombifrons TaxID=233779 RepID=UPI00234BC1C9|nr:T-cell activation inhibitor, mitochondrial isoform X2 [Spea bombifrons]